MLERDLLEVVGQRRRGERPRPVEVRRREPSARDEEVDRPRRAHAEHVALGVADPQQLARRPGPAGRSARPVRRISSAGTSATKTFGALPPLPFQPGRFSFTSFQLPSSGSFLKLSGRSVGGLPRALHVGRLQPDLVAAEVVGLRRAVLEEIPVGVDRRLQIVLLDRRPDRIAVDVDEHRRRLAEEDRRRIGLHAVHVLRNDLARVDSWRARGRARSRDRRATSTP